jgi:N-acetylglutamate synthase-like GNAT family acetyltransferase
VNELKSANIVMQEFTIREAVVTDAYLITDLLKELGYSNSVEFVLSEITELAGSNKDFVLVAEADGKVIGFAYMHIMELFFKPGSRGRVMAIAVSNESKRFGVGRKLMMSLEAIARDAACVDIEIASAIYRKDAHAFFKSLGYAEEAKRFVKNLPIKSKPSL